MSTFRLIRLGDPEAADARVVGGKAASLARLRAGGADVPAWFVVVSSEVPAPEAPGTQAVSDPEDSPSDLAGGNSLGLALHELGADADVGARFAVRSSAADEDGAEHSFAGQFESFLDVAAADVVEFIARVRRSHLSERVRAYRAERGLSAPAEPPAVIVQCMVDARYAGVVFTVDPVSGDAGAAVVAAVAGVGESLVSGEQQGETFAVDRRGVVTRRGHAAATCGISDVDVAGVAAEARRLAQAFGVELDVEWAIGRVSADGDASESRLFILQARPITTLGHGAPPGGPCAARSAPSPPGSTRFEGPRPELDREGAPLSIWDNSNIAESYGGVTSPLTFSFARHAYEHVYRSFCRLLGVPDAVIERSRSVYADMLGCLEGRVYYNLLNWYRLLAMLPGFAMNKGFMEQMMGVGVELPPDLAAAMIPAAGWRRFVQRASLVRVVVRLVVLHLRLPRFRERFLRRLDTSLSVPRDVLGAMRADQLVAHYRELESSLLLKWDAPIVNDFLVMIFHGSLRTLGRRWIDAGEERGIENDLVRGMGGVISAEPAERLAEMAALVRPHQREAAILSGGSPAEQQAAVDRVPGLRAALDQYLDRFADRCLEELKLESPTLDDDPGMLHAVIGRLAQREPPPVGAGEREAAVRSAAERRARGATRLRPLRRMLFFWVARVARERVRDRENLRFERTRVFGRVRRIVVELGVRLRDVGVLDHPHDVFYLHIDELLGYVEGAGVSVDLRGLAAVRKQEHARFTASPPPPSRFSTRGSVNPLRPIAAAAPHDPPSAGRVSRTGEAPAGSAPADAGSEADASDSRRGLGCCAGVVRGRARVVRDPRGAQVLPGEILVAERTDPGWIMLFPSAAGVIVERGSLLSHSAIVARELGIASVVGVPGLTAWLRTGDLIEMDGAAGEVRRLEKAAAEPGQ